MKKLLSFLLAGAMVLTLAACGAKEEYDPSGDICPGKLLGPEGTDTVLAAGLDPNEDMSFETTDVKGNTATNEIFAGTNRGVWVVFWKTDNGKSEAELKKLSGMTDTAKKYGYKILGVVMDGEKNAKRAGEMTADLTFDNIIWNDSMASRFQGISDFFEKETIEKIRAEMKAMGLETLPELGDPVSTRTNSRGQIQTACTLVPVAEAELEETWEMQDSNATYEELVKQGQDALNGKR